MAAGTPTNPEVLQEIVSNVLVKPLEDRSVILGAGVRMFDSDGSPIRVPKLNDDSSEPDWVGENELIPDDYEPNFSEVLLLPRTLKGVKEISRFSNELMRQSVVNIQATIQERLVRRVTTKIDEAFISGLGVPVGVNRTQPEGLLTWTGTQAMPGVGVLSLDHLHDALGLAMAADVDPTRLRWLMRSDTFVSLKKLKDTSGKYLITPDPTEAGVFRLLGFPVIITNRIPVDDDVQDTTCVVLADMSTIAVGRDMNPSIKVLTERYAEFDQIGIRIVCRYDVQPLLPEAVIVLRDVNA